MAPGSPHRTTPRADRDHPTLHLLLRNSFSPQRGMITTAQSCCTPSHPSLSQLARGTTDYLHAVTLDHLTARKPPHFQFIPGVISVSTRIQTCLALLDAPREHLHPKRLPEHSPVSSRSTELRSSPSMSDPGNYILVPCILLSSLKKQPTQAGVPRTRPAVASKGCAFPMIQLQTNQHSLAATAKRATIPASQHFSLISQAPSSRRTIAYVANAAQKIRTQNGVSRPGERSGTSEQIHPSRRTSQGRVTANRLGALHVETTTKRQRTSCWSSSSVNFLVLVA